MSDNDITEQDFLAAFERVGRTEDGRLIYLYLQKTLCGVTVKGVPESTLREDTGTRRFASELMGLMAKGVEESGGRGTDQPIVFARRQPVATGQHTSPREWLKQHPDVNPTVVKPE